jgi:predicted GNAT superfamily acetyltransferase
MSGLEGFAVRNVTPADWDRVTAVLVEWWQGRDLSDLLPRLFFQHFCTTSWLVEQDGELVAFLVGFVCPTHDDEAYIHFVGVDPELRGRGIAKGLYELFFDVARAQGRSVVRVITSPVNQASLAFHSHIGFVMLPGDGEQDGVPIWLDYDGPGRHRVRLERRLR